MITRLLRRVRAGHGSERGVALITVVAIGAVLMIMVATMAAFSTSGLVKSSSDENWNAAMAAAYAGIADYESKLANDNSYVKYGNAAAAFSHGDTFAGTDGNPAFGTGTSGTWAEIKGADGHSSWYRYAVDNSQYANTGSIKLEVTGRVGSATRSLVADLKQQGFIDFLYFTDYEVQDPDISGQGSGCATYAWAGRSSRCTSIQFGPNDVINGPVHSNDTLSICGATFNGPVTTSDNPSHGNRYSTPSGCGSPHFAVAGSPAYSPVVAMPATNSTMKQEVRSDLPETVPRPGCLYTGPTSIVFNSDGTMTVRSPWTRYTNVAGDPPSSGSVNAACGTPNPNTTASAAKGTLGDPAGQTIAVPKNNLIFVQSVPHTAGDPNYWASNTCPKTGVDCQVSSDWFGGKTLTCYGASGQKGGNGIGFPMAGEADFDTSSSTPSYGCDKGDVFVQGKLKGNVTVAADNYVYVTGDITYTDANADMLGLVGQNAVWVWNPMDRRDDPLLSKNRTIDAAILSVGHTFQVQNYNVGGGRGTLTVLGAIAQKFRGPVGLSNGVGYDKNYQYDARFRYMAPPKFLSPVSTTYGMSSVVEVPAAYSADGRPTS